VGADENDDNGEGSGSAYVFRWNGSSWVEEQKLLPSDGAAEDYFGCSVSISGNVALVGADENDDNGEGSGSAYVFRWNGSSWVEEQKLLPSDGAAYDWFGESVSISGDVALVGAVLNDDDGADSGSAYVYTLTGCTVLGDLNADCSIDLQDAGLALRVQIGMDTSGLIRPDYATSGADVAGDGKIGLEEIIYIMQRVSELR